MRSRPSARRSRKNPKVQAKVIETDNYRYWDSWVCDGTRPHLFEINVASGAAKDLFAGKRWTLGLGDPGPADYAISPDGKEIVWSQPDDSDAADLAQHVDPSEPQVAQEQGDRSRRHVARRTRLLARWHPPRRARDAHVRAQPAHAADAGGPQIRQGRTSRRQSGRARSAPTAVPTRHGVPTIRRFCSAPRMPACSTLWSLPLTAEAPTAIAMAARDGVCAVGKDGATTVFHQGIHRSPGAALHAWRGRRQTAPPSTAPMRSSTKVPLGKWQSRAFRAGTTSRCRPSSATRRTTTKEKKYPLLHSIHGGPHAAHMDTWHYRWNVHAFAAQGYVVAAVNYHGSSGFDERFLGIIDGDLGQRELADTEAVTDALIREGIVDKKRLYAAGGSYGRLHGRLDERPHRSLQGLRVPRRRLQLGQPVRRRWLPVAQPGAGLLAVGNLENTSRNRRTRSRKTSKTPTLVIHGELDYRVPYYEGLEYYNTLRAKGHRVTARRLPRRKPLDPRRRTSALVSGVLIG